MAKLEKLFGINDDGKTYTIKYIDSFTGRKEKVNKSTVILNYNNRDGITPFANFLGRTGNFPINYYMKKSQYDPLFMSSLIKPMGDYLNGFVSNKLLLNRTVLNLLVVSSSKYLENINYSEDDLIALDQRKNSLFNLDFIKTKEDSAKFNKLLSTILDNGGLSFDEILFDKDSSTLSTLKKESNKDLSNFASLLCEKIATGNTQYIDILSNLANYEHFPFSKNLEKIKPNNIALFNEIGTKKIINDSINLKKEQNKYALTLEKKQDIIDRAKKDCADNINIPYFEKKANSIAKDKIIVLEASETESNQSIINLQNEINELSPFLKLTDKKLKRLVDKSSNQTIVAKSNIVDNNPPTTNDKAPIVNNITPATNDKANLIDKNTSIVDKNVTSIDTNKTTATNENTLTKVYQSTYNSLREFDNISSKNYININKDDDKNINNDEYNARFTKIVDDMINNIKNKNKINDTNQNIISESDINSPEK